MNKKRVELLAPAGNMECFMAALKGGADAVYMAGKSFGARASASNFEAEEFIEALKIAHIHNKKIYLTLNTLIKEKEWSDIFDFLRPLYEFGLDGVIIQDLGLIEPLKKSFPSLELHASTQMTITDSLSAKLLKENGIVRIVPARELSLNELKKIKKDTGLEIETFIHGALCYCYSGQCLFSSFLGGRSGNRGRCAGPCRLPYAINKNGKIIEDEDKYPLSLKDLCTVSNIADLIEAGIDSFKIEGRLKSAEYVYGVTSIYRKYIDLYYSGQDTTVDKNDLKILENLYLRSSIGSGYYYRHNGKDMISIDDPSYNSMDKNVISDISQELNNSVIQRSLNAYCFIHADENMLLTLYDDETSVTVSGDVIQKASNRPASREDILSKLSKTGGTSFCFDNIELDMDNSSFVPVKSINELRRFAISRFEDEVLKTYYRNDFSNRMNTFSNINERCHGSYDRFNDSVFGVRVYSLEQLKAVLNYQYKELYIPYDLYYLDFDNVDKIVKELIDKDIYITLPRIIRERDDKYLHSLRSFVETRIDLLKGILVSNLEELEYIRNYINNTENLTIKADYTLYTWNKSSKAFINKYVDNCALPVELSINELTESDNENTTMVIYGHAPLMVSANCIAKTMNACTKNKYGGEYSLTDRYRKEESVLINCVHCYNEIYNSVPTSLHKKLDQIRFKGIRNLRIDFTIEDTKKCKEVMEYYFTNKYIDFPVLDYTTGHYDKGAI